MKIFRNIVWDKALPKFKQELTERELGFAVIPWAFDCGIQSYMVYYGPHTSQEIWDYCWANDLV